MDDWEVNQHRSDFAWWFDSDRAERYLSFYRQFPFVKGERATRGEYFSPEPWQAYLLSQLAGWRSKDDDAVNRFLSCLLFQPRKNGKTTTYCLIMLSSLFLGDAAGECLSVATNEKQAKLGMNTAIDMFRKMGSDHPLLLKTRVVNDGIEVIRADGGARWWRAMSSRAKSVEGVNASMVAVDEAALCSRAVVDSLIESTMGRKSPLVIYLSTAQPDADDSLFVDELQAFKAGLDSGKGVERTFGLCYEITRGLHETDDEIFSRISSDKSLWKLANPSLGVALYESLLERRLQAATTAVGMRPGVLLKHFNVWASASHQWIDTPLFDALPPAIDEGRVFIACDIGLTGDLTGICVLRDLGTGAYSAKVTCYVPQVGIDSVSEATRLVYENALSAGELVKMGTDILDKAQLIEVMLKLVDEYKPVAVGLDPWRAQDLVKALEEKGQQVLIVKQGGALTPAVLKCEELIGSGKLHHDENRFMRWMISNSRRKDLNNGRVQIVKDRYEAKIDGVMSLIDAVFIALAGESAVSNFEVIGWDEPEDEKPEDKKDKPLPDDEDDEDYNWQTGF